MVGALASISRLVVGCEFWWNCCLAEISLFRSSFWFAFWCFVFNFVFCLLRVESWLFGWFRVIDCYCWIMDCCLFLDVWVCVRWNLCWDFVWGGFLCLFAFVWVFEFVSVSICSCLGFASGCWNLVFSASGLVFVVRLLFVLLWVMTLVGMLRWLYFVV